ncbi:ribonuclease Z [Chloroflexota bacterium]
MFEILFLGTGGSVPSSDRALNATFIRYESTRFLIDCGDGAQYPLLRNNGVRGDCLKVFITHEHTDHLIGLIGLLYTLEIRGDKLLVEVYGGVNTIEKIRGLIDLAEIRNAVELIHILPGTIWEDNHIVCEAFKTQHTESSYGFIIEEKERRHFVSSKADELRIPHGDIRKQLTQGNTVSLLDGTIIEPYMVFSEPQKGTKVVYVGDTAYNIDLAKHCEGADCLIIEATYVEKDSELAKRNKHLTAKQAASIAKQSSVTALYLNHITTRYNDDVILDEAKSDFIETFIAHDTQSVKVSNIERG